MLEWLKKKWLKFLEDRRTAHQIDPESFRRYAGELRDLAVAAGRLWPDEQTFQDRIRRIRSEMEQLDLLASRPEFRRLSVKRRLELRDSLMQSREQLMETVQTAPTPTTILQ